MKYIINDKTFKKKQSKSPKFNTDGEFVEYYYNQDDYYKAIIDDFLQDYDSTIKMSNIVDNVLNKILRTNLLKTLNSAINNTDKKNFDYTKDVTASVALNESLEVGNGIGGRNIFISFLRLCTVHNGSNMINSKDNTPNDFLITYECEVNDKIDFLDVINSRYKSFSSLLLNKIDLLPDTFKLFYGIRNDMKIVYGIIGDDNVHIIGQFNLNINSCKFILNLNSNSIKLFKKEFYISEFKEIQLLNKVNKEFNDMIITIDYLKDYESYLENGILIYKFKNVGIWENGNMDNNNLQDIKNKLNTKLLNFKWVNNILTSTKAENYNIYFLIKNK